MKRITVALTALLTLGLLSGPALAHHEHQLVNPGTTVTFKCEPAAAADLHPIHEGLHVALRDRGNGPTRVWMTTRGTLDQPVCVY